MEGAEKGDKEAPPLQIDPKCLQDALRSFFQPIKTDDPRVDFYTMYKREATEYDMDFVKKHIEDLNTTLIFAGFFSIVSSAFVIDVHSNLRPNPNEQSVVLLRAILLTLNQSAIPAETPVIPPVQERPPNEIVTVTCLIYASLLISLFTAFVAMLAKQWLNRYLRNSGGSMIEHCGDRQRKFDGLKKWPLHFFIESLPVMLQVSLLLLACGLCRHMWSINASVARTLVSLTGLGVIFYIAIVIAGMSSYACPFQTPASIVLRGPWKKVQHGIISSTVHLKRTLSRIRGMWKRRVRPLLRRQSLPIIPLGNVRVQWFGPWFELGELAMVRRTNTDDVRCVSWVLGNITDPEALDAALPIAGEIRWLDDGVNVRPPYHLIVSTFESCFDSTKTLYPGSRDRAYYSGRALIWINALARCSSEGYGWRYPLPSVRYTTPAPDPDLEHLLGACSEDLNAGRHIELLLRTDPGHTHLHSQWISNLLLHRSRASNPETDHVYILSRLSVAHETKTTIPLNVGLNRILAWCTFLGLPIEEEALKVPDKSDLMDPILSRLSEAVPSAINGTPTQQGFIPHVLRDLVKLENRPDGLTEVAYQWCSVISENRERLQDWENLLLLCLEIGFRHLDPQRQSIKATLTHTEHHRGLADIVFKSQESEAVADLLCAWTSETKYPKPAYALLDPCAGHLVDLHNLVPFSPRLRRFAIYSIGFIGYKKFEEVGVERFTGLLDYLRVKVEDISVGYVWARLLFDTIQSSEGIKHLSDLYWELLVELLVSLSSNRQLEITYNPQTTRFLTEAQEWGKLECWIGTVWMPCPPEADGATEEDLGRSMGFLFRQRPGALQKLEQWMERWSQRPGNHIPDAFQRLCGQAYEAAQRDAPLITSVNK